MAAWTSGNSSSEDLPPSLLGFTKGIPSESTTDLPACSLDAEELLVVVLAEDWCKPGFLSVFAFSLLVLLLSLAELEKRKPFLSPPNVDEGASFSFVAEGLVALAMEVFVLTGNSLLLASNLLSSLFVSLGVFLKAFIFSKYSDISSSGGTSSDKERTYVIIRTKVAK